MGPQNPRDAKHPDSAIKQFKALVNNTQDASHRVAIYTTTRGFNKYKSRNLKYISDEQLHPMELCMYHGIKVSVESLDSNRISQMCRYTGNQSWSGGDRRNDWVWVNQRPGRCYGALNGPLP
jgi:hypothetical protein